MEVYALMALTVIRASAFPVIPAITAKQVFFFNAFKLRISVMCFILDIGECLSEPCHNGGTCIDDVDAFACICVSGYTGDVCETSEEI